MTRSAYSLGFLVALPALPIVIVATACGDPVVPSSSDESSTTAVDATGSSEGGVESTGGVSISTSTGAVDSTPDGSDTSGPASSSSGADTCGNGMLEPEEQCEPGMPLGGEDCISQGFDVGRLSCADDCMFDTSGCALAECGNGVIEAEEICDGEDFGAESCEGQGFDGGVLECSRECTLDDSHCTTTTEFCSMVGFTLIEPGTLVIPAMTMPVEGTLVGVDIYLDVTHSSVGFLDLSVEHVPSGTSVALAQNICGPANDIDAIFDQDAAAPPDCMEPDAIEGNVLPAEDLDAFLGVADPSGPWTLTIVDSGPGDTDPGVMHLWCVRFETEAVER